MIVDRISAQIIVLTIRDLGTAVPSPLPFSPSHSSRSFESFSLVPRICRNPTKPYWRSEVMRTSSSAKMADSDFQADLRCHHCAGPLSKAMETSAWTVQPFVRDSFSMIGSAVGGTASAFYGFNHVMPLVRKWIKGPMWVHFLIGAPPVIVLSSACAGLAGGAVPALAQLASSSYHAVVSTPSPPVVASGDDKVQKSTTSSTM